jgi:hypothetical protein
MSGSLLPTPFRIFCGVIAIFVSVLAYLTLNPKLDLATLPSVDPNAAFGTKFQLTNDGFVTLHEVRSVYCGSHFTVPSTNTATADGVVNYGSAGGIMALGNLEHGDSVILPFEHVFPAADGAGPDVVFTVRYRPGLAFWDGEKEFRFKATETTNNAWVWSQVPLENSCD